VYDNSLVARFNLSTNILALLWLMFN